MSVRGSGVPQGALGRGLAESVRWIESHDKPDGFRPPFPATQAVGKGEPGGILPGVRFALCVDRLERRLRGLPSLLVALSGGVDSAVLLGAAVRSVRGKLLAATTRSPAVPDEEVEAAARVARVLGVSHKIVETHELEDARYRANAGDRCYFCRVSMYGGLLELAEAEGIEALADGLQQDDEVTDRPGVRAAAERGILHPLRDAGLGKAAVRRLARAYGIAIADKPAQPCLASRLPVGVEVSAARLVLVHRAESALRKQGFLELRVRCERTHGRIEIGQKELVRARQMAGEIEALVVDAGFVTATLDPAGYR